MNEITQVIIWWTGAVVVLSILLVLTGLVVLTLKYTTEILGNKLFRIASITTSVYWVQRMEREGLTACKKDYRRMVAERQPKTIDDFQALEREVTLVRSTSDKTQGDTKDS